MEVKYFFHFQSFLGGISPSFHDILGDWVLRIRFTARKHFEARFLSIKLTKKENYVPMCEIQNRKRQK